jgi:hypothetical protein
MRCVPFAGEWQLDLEEIRGERSPDLPAITRVLPVRK